MDCFILIVLVTVLKFVNAAIFVQAPKYVPKSQLETIVKNYYHQLNRLKAMSNKAIEIEIPVVVPQKYRLLRRNSGGIGRRRKYRKPRKYKSYRQNRRQKQKVTTTAIPIQISTEFPIALIPPLQYPLLPASPPSLSLLPPDPPLLPLFPKSLSLPQSSLPIQPPTKHNNIFIESPVLKPLIPRDDDHLKKVEEQVENLILRLNNNLKIVENTRKSGRKNANNMNHIYKEDIEQALKDLEERLLNGGGQRPATLNDLTRAIEHLERHILEHREMLATSTPEPCGEEMVLVEALKPVRPDDFEEFIKKIENCEGQRTPLDKTRKQFKLNIVNRKIGDDTVAVSTTYTNQNQQNFGENLLALLREKLNMTNSTSAAYNNMRRSYGEEILDLLKSNVQVEDISAPVDEKEVVPIKIEIPKQYNDIIIKTD